MNQNTRQNLMICTVAVVMFGAVAWMIPASKEPGIWKFRIAMMAALLLLIAIYYWAARRTEKAPDFLSGISNTFFEKDGFAFLVGAEVIDGICHLSVPFQN